MSLPAPRVRRLPAALRPYVVEIVLIGLAIGVSGLVVNTIRHHIPRGLNLTTDIVGYPIATNFNPKPLLQEYYLAVVVWPLLAAGLFVVMVALARRTALSLPDRGPLLPAARHEVTTAAASATEAVVPPRDGLARAGDAVAAVARLLGVGFVIGATAAVARDNVEVAFWREALLTALGYAGLAAGAAWLAAGAYPTSQVRSRYAGRLAAVNAAGACVSVLGLVAVSENTTVTTLSDMVVHHYRWFPLWLGVVATAALLAAIAVGLRRAGGDLAAIRRIERRALFLVAVPVFIFITNALLYGQLGAMDTFEEGQQLTTIRLLQHGTFPWRDWLDIHGLLVDTFVPALGFNVFDPSRWGAAVSFVMIAVPLSWLSLYYFAYRIVGASWAAILAAVVIFYNSHATALPDPRFFLWPLLLVLLATALDRGTAVPAVILGFVLIAAAVLTPEMAYAIAACGIAVLMRDLYRARWRRGEWMAYFTPTLSCVGGGALALVLLLGVLLSEHALSGFLGYYTDFVHDHDLTGGVPFIYAGLEKPYRIWVFIPAVGVLVAALILGVKLWLRRTLETVDYVMIGAAAMAILYYQKFTGRADPPHLAQVYWVCTPLFIVVAWQLLIPAEALTRQVLGRRTRGGVLRHPLAWLALAVLVATPPIPLNQLYENAAVRFRANATQYPWSPATGYANFEGKPVYDDMAKFLAAYLRPGERIYDFANEPGLLYFVLGYTPSTRYFVVTNAIAAANQDDLVDELRSERPRFAVLFGDAPGALPVWDGLPNPVRHYKVAQYLLDNFQPFANVDGQLIYVDRALDPIPLQPALPEARQPAFVDNIPFRFPECDWGYAPNFLSIDHPSEASAAPVGLASVSPTEWTLTPPLTHSWSDYHWIEIETGSRFPDSPYALNDEVIVDVHHRVTFETLDRGQQVYRIPIGACPQWHGYQARVLHLTSGGPVDIRAVRLLP